MRMNPDYVASGHFVLGEMLFASSIIGHWQYASNKGMASVKLLYL